MHKLGKAAAIALAWLLAGPAAGQSPPSPSPPTPAPAQADAPALPPAELRPFLDGWMSAALARSHTPGAAVAIVQDGQVILKTGYGWADLGHRRPVDPDTTLFRLGSLSSAFTWVLLMQEAEAGRLRLDRPVNLYLPEKVRLPGRGRSVMVGQLMAHSAGFEDRVLGRFVEDSPRRVRPLELYLRENRPAIVRTPGLLSSYTAYDAALAGEAVSFVSGETFEHRAETRLFLPLGMTRTTFREPRDERRGLPAAMPAAWLPDVARGYLWRHAGYEAAPYEYRGQAAPAAGASSTAADMARFMRMLLADGHAEGATVFGADTAQAFRTPVWRAAPGVNGWAHGFMVYDLPGGRTGYGHEGEAIAFHASLVVVPDLRLGVFVATNGQGGAALARDLPAVLIRRFYGPPAPPPRPGAPGLVGQGPVFDGRYLSTQRAYRGLEGFVGLWRGGADVEVTAGGRLLLRRDGAATAWLPDSSPDRGLFTPMAGDGRLAFHIRDGQAWSFQTADNTELFERAGLAQRPTVLLALSGMAALAAVMTLLGAAQRNRRELRQNSTQARAGLIQNIQAGLWLAAIGLFAVWWRGARDEQALMYGWPGPLVVTASACALVAAALCLVTLAALPAVWQGGRRVDSWSGVRKTFFTLTVLIYSALSVVLAMGGALEPWSG